MKARGEGQYLILTTDDGLQELSRVRLNSRQTVEKKIEEIENNLGKLSRTSEPTLGIWNEPIRRWSFDELYRNDGVNHDHRFLVVDHNCGIYQTCDDLLTFFTNLYENVGRLMPLNEELEGMLIFHRVDPLMEYKIITSTTYQLIPNPSS